MERSKALRSESAGKIPGREDKPAFQAMASRAIRQLGIVIPVYGSSGNLRQVVAQLRQTKKQLPGWQYHIVIVDDGSRPPIDASLACEPQIHLLRHPVNQGKGAALKTGFRYLLNHTPVEAIATLDADGQHPPRYLPEFVARFLISGTDLVIGYRRRQLGQMPFPRIISNTWTSTLISLLTGQVVRDSQCGYRLYSRELLEKLSLQENRFHLESEALIKAGWAGAKISWIPLPTIYNGAPSTIRHLPDTMNFLQLVFQLAGRRILGSL